MNFEQFKNVECIWDPKGYTDPVFMKFLKFFEDKYKVKLNDYWDLHKWSVENIAEFWAEVWNLSGIKYSKKYNQVIDLSVPMSSPPKWFDGAELNIAEDLLTYRDDKVAMICIGEDREKRIVTYAQVYEETKRYASAFRKHGIKKGDRVVCYMSNREEAIFAALATISIGALWIGILPLLGAKAVLERVQKVNPCILITVDRLCYDHQEHDILPKLKEIVHNLPTLEKVIIIPTKLCSKEKDISGIRNSCFLEEFLNPGENEGGDIQFEQVPFSHPVFVSYTSGTTGVSKLLVHGNGCIISSMLNHLLRASSRENVILTSSPVGWASWNMALFHLLRGGGNVLYDGVPYTFTPTHLWDIVDEYKVTSFFVTPGILDDLEKRGYLPTEKHTLTSLRAIVSGASVVKPQNYDFVLKKIKPDILFASAHGSTEVMGALLLFHISLPIHKGEISCPNLGVDLQCLDDEGNNVVGLLGELFINKPLPAMPLGIYGDADGTKFKEIYFSKYPDKFRISDLAVINPVTKGINIYCRSDEVLNPHGSLFGSSEIYNVVNVIPEIHDSLCVSQYSKNKAERAVLFIKVRKGYKFNEDLVQKVLHTIEDELSDEHLPGLVLPVPDIPYNINGKKMEILIKKIINKMPYNSDVVINKDCLQYFQTVPPFEN